jgi:hypothetical protein
MSARTERYGPYVGAAAVRHRRLDAARRARLDGGAARAAALDQPPPAVPDPNEMHRAEIERLSAQIQAARQAGGAAEARELEARLSTLLKEEGGA